MTDVVMEDLSSTKEEIIINNVDELEVVFLRLTMISTDRGLQTFTNQYLIPIIQLAAPDLPYLDKLNELLGHYNKRVRGNMEVQLPTEGLIHIITNGTSMHFRLATIYLRWSIDRSTDRIQYLAGMMRAAGARRAHKDEQMELFAMMVPPLNDMAALEKTNSIPIDLVTLLAEDEAIRTDFVRWLIAVLSYQAVTKEHLAGLSALNNQGKPIMGAATTLAGLSVQEFFSIAVRVADQQPEQFKQIKRSIVKVVDRSLLPEHSTFPVLIVALSSPLTDVSELAEGAVKKIDVEECVGDKSVIDHLFLLYTGTVKKLPANMSVIPRDWIYPAAPQTKFRLLNYIRRSPIAPKAFMTNLVVARDGARFAMLRKLQVSGLQFLLAVIGNLPPSGVKVLAPALFSELRGLLSQETTDDALALVYACIGRLGRAHPPLIKGDLAFVKECFEAVVKHAKDDGVSQSVVDCLVEWLPLFKISPDDTTAAGSHEMLHSLVAHFVTNETARVRMVALKYIESLLSPSSLDLHWMLIRASGDRREEMRREAKRMLEAALIPRLTPPTLDTVVELYGKWSEWSKGGGIREENEDHERVIDEVKQDEQRMVVTMLARFIWATGMVHIKEGTIHASDSLLSGEDGEAEWRRSYPMVVNKVFVPLQSSNGDTAQHLIDIFLAAVAVSHGGDNFLLRIARCALARLPLASSSEYATAAASTSERLVRGSHRTEISAEAAELAAALVDDQDERLRRADEIMEGLQSESTVPGLVWLSVSLLSSNCKLPMNEEQLKKRNTLVGQLVKILTMRCIDGYQRPNALLEASLGALAKLLQRLGEVIVLTPSEVDSILEICVKIAITRNDGFSSLSRDAAATVIGTLPGVIGEGTEEEKMETDEKSLYRKCIDSLFSIGEGPPRPELQFAVGEALFGAATAGVLCSTRRDEYTMNEMDWRDIHASSSLWPSVYGRLESIINEIIDDKARAPNPHLRRSTTVWLLVLTQKYIDSLISPSQATPRPPGDEMIHRLQSAFVDGLSESDDFCQDIASKGIGIVYNLANESLKKVLVNELMCTFSEGKRETTRGIISDTPVLEGGRSIKTSGGEQLTTYKEMSSLAMELHDPDLLYKFMQLAKHNATWNAKKGAAFGFSVVFEQARQELEPYVAQLVPKLYRYRYDPDGKVQSSMKSIWSVLTSSRKGVVDEFADAIAAEIIPTLTHSEWRVRESSCLAYADLLSGHCTRYMIDRLPDTLQTVFRVQDDVKESVRKAADRTAMAIKKACLSEAGSTNAQRSGALLGPLLPALVDGAAHAPIPKNKQFCLLLLVDLSAQCGKQMKPFIPQVVPCLLDAISEIEPWQLNYVAARSDARDLEDLDDARARIAGSSTLMHAAQQLMPYVGKEELEKMQPRMSEQLKNSVGVSTRTATAQLVTHFCLQAPQLMIDCPSVCDKLFSALRSSALRDRNPSVRKQFSSALSYLARFCGHAQMEALVKEARAELIGSEEDKKVAVRNLLKSLVANATELLTAHASMLVPYVLMEKCQEPIKGDEESKKKCAAWDELWAELVPSTETAVRMYGEEIVSTGVEILRDNQVWAVRAQAAMMIKEVASVPGQLTPEKAQSVLVSLLSFLNGRYWTGKERILSAISALFDKYGGELQTMMNDEKKFKETFDVLLREANRRSKPQSLAGLKALAQFAASTRNIEAAETALKLLKKRVDRESSREDDNGKKDDDNTSSEEEQGQSDMTKMELAAVRHTRLAEAVGIVGVAMRAYREADDVIGWINFISETMISPSVFYRVKQSIVSSLEEYLEKPSWSGSINWSRPSLSIVEFASEMQSSQRRTAAVNALGIISRLVDLSSSNQVLLDEKLLVPRLESFDDSLPKEMGILNKMKAYGTQ